jgi:membrane associated rhomboid family serine protease
MYYTRENDPFLRPIPRRDGPTLLFLIILVNVAVMLLQSLYGGHGNHMPYGAVKMDSLKAGHFWTLLTHQFVHFGWIHLGLNMGLLVLGGISLQRQVGQRHFGCLYVLGGAVGAAAQLGVVNAAIIGASGAVFAVLAALATLNPYENVFGKFQRYVPVRLKLSNLVLAMVLVEVALEIATRLWPSHSLYFGGNAAHLTHVVGAVTGWIYAVALKSIRPVQEPPKTLFRMGESPFTHFPSFIGAKQSAKVEAGEEWKRPVTLAPQVEALSEREYLQQVIDPILDKLNQGGYGSLTEVERDTLAQASLRLGGLEP